MGKYAIVGLACLFPGAGTPDDYWRNLIAGVDSRTDGDNRVFGHPPRPGRPTPRTGTASTAPGVVSWTSTTRVPQDSTRRSTSFPPTTW